MGQQCNNCKRLSVRLLRLYTRLVIACACSVMAHAHVLTVSRSVGGGSQERERAARLAPQGQALVVRDFGQLHRRRSKTGLVFGAGAGSAHGRPDFRALRAPIVLQRAATADKHHTIRVTKRARKHGRRSGSGCHWRMYCGSVGTPGGLGASKVDSDPSRWDCTTIAVTSATSCKRIQNAISVLHRRIRGSFRSFTAGGISKGVPHEFDAQILRNTEVNVLKSPLR